MEKNRPVVIIFSGNVGTGKSTLAKKMVKYGYLVWNNDNFINMASAGTTTFFGSKHHKIIKKMRHIFIKSCLAKENNLVVDATHMTRLSRSKIIECVRSISQARYGNEKAIRLISIDFGSGTEYSLERRQTDPKETEPVKWLSIHNNFKKMYQKPERSEGFEVIMEFSRLTEHELELL